MGVIDNSLEARANYKSNKKCIGDFVCLIQTKEVIIV